MTKLDRSKKDRLVKEAREFRDHLLFKFKLGNLEIGDIVEDTYHNEVGVIVGRSKNLLADGARYIVITKFGDTGSLGVRYPRVNNVKLLEKRTGDIVEIGPITRYCENHCLTGPECSEVCGDCPLIKLKNGGNY